MKNLVLPRSRYIAKADCCAMRMLWWRFVVDCLLMPLVARWLWLRMHLKRSAAGEELKKMVLEQEMIDSSPEKKVRRWRYDIVAAYVRHCIKPYEYVMFHFENKSTSERRSYLGDRELDFVCADRMSWPTFRKLRDKYVFYSLARPYFKRDVCPIRQSDNYEEFEAFVRKHPTFFLKNNGLAFGKGCSIERAPEDLRAYFDNLLKESNYLAEELIVQDAAMARWNETSVNTVRLCSFKKEGEVRIVYPFMRAGRKGSVVDNGGSGGIFASIDVDTGVICTNGGDETGASYEIHPDSGVPFKGEPIPRWSELLELCREIHLSLAEEFVYIGFDFAYTARGWMLIEGNWGQFAMQQVTLNRGLRKEFEELMDVRMEA